MQKKSLLDTAAKKDLEKLEKRLTKKIEQVLKELDRNQKIFRFEIMSNTIDVRQRLEKQIYEFKNDLYTKINPILAEVEDARIDRELSTEQAEEFKAKIKMLETKVKKLEAGNKQN